MTLFIFETIRSLVLAPRYGYRKKASISHKSNLKVSTTLFAF